MFARHDSPTRMAGAPVPVMDTAPGRNIAPVSRLTRVTSRAVGADARTLRCCGVFASLLTGDPIADAGLILVGILLLIVLAVSFAEWWRGRGGSQ